MQEQDQSPLREIIFLGCGGSSGVPMIGGPDGKGYWGDCDPQEPRNRRTRSSIMLAGEEHNLLVDTGPDLRHQLLSCGISRCDAIFYTHAHADHIAGLDDVRAINWTIKRPIEAWGSPETLQQIEQRFSYAFQPWTPQDIYRPGLTAHPVTPGETITIAGFTLDVFLQSHGRLNSLGFRHADIAYCTDVVELEDSVLDSLRDLDIWIVDCFQRLPPHTSHAWLDRVLQWHARIRPRRTILTHLGPTMDWAWMKQNLPEGTEPAFDGLRVRI
ncbi:MBL fold metallo-hydrolase [Acetobacter sp. AN02]|uniref:MBL fold metallo-hydrolase n=1 Tax=Acetobacter sp. AN02 TaxID=2894186 RepID=UPI002434327C|nr:MBL fold metallo-hydrolase [Acetobacter sp. AN02]MDG6093768.1 MBL fold metallo-hydrolase [Acetobacter sp. AN02]